MQFAEKFALKYYCFLFFHFMIFYFIHYLHNSHLAMSFVGVNLLIGGFFFDDIGNTTKSKEYNRNIFHVGPLIVSCIMSFVMYWVFWVNYEEIVKGSIFLWLMTIMSLSQSVVASIDASHELIHRNETWCRVIGVTNLWLHQFTAYPIEHLYLHHKKVGSAEDPITSPKNQTVYSYYVNAILSAYKFNYNYNKTYFAICVIGTLTYNLFFIGLGLSEQASLGKILMFVLVSYVTVFWM